VFGYISSEKGIIRWPQLPDHESNRIIAMEEAVKAALSGQTIVSDDHRVVQAMAMWGKVNNVEVNFSNPNAVKKSWPQFWRFLEVAKAA
jgi:5-enolpyruvylshikimate-3-phosphate synthase